jgi:hypothetical protein
MLNRIMIIPYYLVILIPNNGIIWYNNHIIIPKMFRFHLPASLPDWRGLATTLEVLTTHNIEAWKMLTLGSPGFNLEIPMKKSACKHG